MSEMHMGSLGENTLAVLLEHEVNVPSTTKVLRSTNKPQRRAPAKPSRKRETNAENYSTDCAAFSADGDTNTKDVGSTGTVRKKSTAARGSKDDSRESKQDETDVGKYFKDSIAFFEDESINETAKSTRNLVSTTRGSKTAVESSKRDETDVAKYFEDSIIFIEDGDTNDEDVGGSKQIAFNASKHSAHLPEREETDLAKYFEDSIAFSENIGRNVADVGSSKEIANNVSSAGCSKKSAKISKRNETEAAKRSQSTNGKNGKKEKKDESMVNNVCTAGISNRILTRDESDIGKYFTDSIIMYASGATNNISEAKNASRVKRAGGTTKRASGKTRSLQKGNESSMDKYFEGSMLLSGEPIERKASKYRRKISEIQEESFNIEDECLNIAENADDGRKPTNIIPDTESENAAIVSSADNKADSEAISCSPVGQILANVMDSKMVNTEIRRDASVKANEEPGNVESSPSFVKETSIIPTQDRCNLAAWGLPPGILQKYESMGVKTMFPWQVECLSNHRLLQEDRNLVYSAPTSAGKTLVAEILVIKTILERQKKVIFILPFISVVREKMFYFQDLLSSSGIRVEGFMGGNAPAGGFAATHVAVATIEKANSLVNRLMEEGGLVNLGAVVVDELHLLGDPHRGYLLELLLTKLKYMTLREEHVKVQLIGMSATLPNLSLLAEWLDAELYKTEFRPVPLNEQCKIDKTIYDGKLVPIRKLVPSPELSPDNDNIIQLCIETIADGHSVLIFCPTKNWCEKLAHQIAGIFFKLGSQGTPLGMILKEQLHSSAISETLEQLKRCPVGLDDVLKSTVSFGVAFHHAGLTMDERDIIEGSFRTGSLRVLIATSTLSSGVNLPARRVIIRSVLFHGKVLDALTYRQMIGRAGRMGKDTAGESILICKPNERRAAESLLSASLEPISSCLEGAGPLIRALLEAVASEVAYTPEDVSLYTGCTLVSFSDGDSVQNPTIDAMKFLVDNEFIMLQKTKEGGTRWVATPLGKACLASSVPPGDGLFLFEELQRARKCFVLETELHVIYLVTPFNSGSQIGQIDWMVFLELWKSLSECERRVGELVGVEERFLMSSLRGVAKPGKAMNIHRRFYTALALHDLVRETPLATVSDKYGCNRGVLQSLQQSAATFAGMVTQFCKQLGWDCMELLVSQFQQRLQFGVCRELLDLLRLPMLNGLRARSLFKEGITCVSELAIADELIIERALHKALPFESEKEQDGEHEAEAAKRNKLRSVFVTGRDGLTPREAAVMLVKEARTLVQHELGVEEVQWKQHEQETNTKMKVKFYSHKTGSNSQSFNDTCAQSSIGKRLPDVPLNKSSTANNEHEVLSNESQVKNTSNPSAEETAKIVTNQNEEVNIDASVTYHQINTIKVPMKATPTASNESVRETKTKLKNPETEAESLKGRRVLPKPAETKIEASMKSVIDENKILQQDKPTKGDEHVQSIGMKGTKKPRFNLLGLQSTEQRKTNNDPMIAENSEGSVVSTNRSKKDSNKAESPFKSPLVEVVTTDSQMDNIKDLDWSSFSKLSSKNKPNPVENGKLEPVKANNMTYLESRSPSLFGDSFSLDTQTCNELEQNINGSMDIFDESNSSKSGVSGAVLGKPMDRLNDYKSLSTNEGHLVANDSKRTQHSDGKRSIVPNNPKSNSPATGDQIPISDEMNFTWNSNDSWNNIKDAMRSQKFSSRTFNEPTKSVPKTTETACVLENSDEIAPTPTTKDDTSKSMISKSRARNLRNAKPLINFTISSSPQKRKRRNDADTESEKSPILSMVSFGFNRRLSIDSPKSDSDDLIVPSQPFEPSIGACKSRTRMKLETKRLATQRLTRACLSKNKTVGNSSVAEIVKDPSSVKNRGEEVAKRREEKPGRNENCDTDSIVFNSDEDTPARGSRERNKTLCPVKQKTETRGKSKKIRLDSDRDDEDWNILDIVNVTRDKRVFNLFKEELKRRGEIAIALACDRFVKESFGIGARILGVPSSEGRSRSQKNESCVHAETRVSGVALSWGRNVVYYICFDTRHEANISLKERLDLLADVLSVPSLNVRCFASKEVYKMLYKCCGITPSCTFLDPTVAEWLLDPEAPEKNFHSMTAAYFPRGVTILQHAGPCIGSSGPGLNVKNTLPGRHRAAAEAAVTWHTVHRLVKKLGSMSSELLETFKEVEMKTISILARMELTGLGVNLVSLQELSTVIQREMHSLEQRAYSLAGRKFHLSSSKEVAQVLGMCGGKKKVSTSKAVLKHCDNPISRIVMSWRKLSATQTKMVFPLLSLAQSSRRIRGSCVTNTVTGRVSMHEPNLQNVPRDFDSADSGSVISVRTAFSPATGNIMLSADYCQLELRILAHFSKDPVLCKILRKDGDVFKSIAAAWNHVSEAEVDDCIRQQTKQLCYGMIYGMGVKTLAEQLSVTEREASKFMETFMGTYPGVRRWLGQVTDGSRSTGYVTTLLGRRRLLPGLNSEIQSEKAQAERQAVNTMVQGSAADLAKKAMVIIEDRLEKEFPNAPKVLPPTTHRKLRSSRESQSRGGYLVLQLHDELLYEVNASDLHRVAMIVKESMERACKLEVPLPVKVKVGPAWGILTEYEP